MARLPLEGIRVVDFTVIVAGPSSAMFLADLGAEVIRLESTQYFAPSTRGIMARPPLDFVKAQVVFSGGYPNRDPGQRPWNRFAWFNAFNRNKRSMTVDLRKPRGMEMFKRLIKLTDVFVENNVPETLDRFGISYELLKAIKPDIIMMRMPGYGTWGPYKNFRAIAPQFEGAFGHTLLRGYPDMDPATRTTNIFFGDLVSGTQSAFAMLAAIHYRQRTGKGQYLELAQAENNILTLGQPFMESVLTGKDPETIGNRDQAAAPCGVYRCQGDDRWIAITCYNDAEWLGLVKAMDNPAWAQDARFADFTTRYQSQDELDQHLQAWTKDWDHYKLFHFLQEHGVPAAPVMDCRDAFNDPHLRARGYFEPVENEDLGRFEYPGMYWKYSGTPVSVRRAPARLGEDNEYVYKTLLGVSDAEYAELEKEGHIGLDYAPHVR